MLGKRGQGLSTNAIILIILGVVILVILILGFTMGWRTLFPFLGGEDNVDTIVQQCSTACSTQNVYDFCSKSRTLKAPELEGGEVVGNCNLFSDIVANPGYTIYSINDCPGLCVP